MKNSKLLQVGLLVLIVVVGAGLAASFPSAEQLISRIAVIGGAAVVLNLWSMWRDERAQKKEGMGVKDDAA
jgi:threonine/homoserine/homoserine lactone efflux protein